MPKSGPAGGSGSGMKKPRTQSPAPNPLLASNKFALLANPEANVDRKEKLPPFYVRAFEGNLKSELDDLIKRGLRASLKLCTDGYKIVVPSKPHFNAVQEYLRQKNAQYFTHDVAADKPFKVVLRGLYDMKEEELAAELTELGLKLVAVHKIRRKQTMTKFRDQLYLLHLKKGSTTLKDLKEIKTVANVIVNWERYRPVHRDVTQCWKCLNFGHGGRNCHLATRCPNCGENHKQDECAAEILVAKCCNCGGDHPSTDRSCPKRAEFIQLRKNVAARKNPGRKKEVPLNPGSFPPLPGHPVPNLTPLPLPRQPKSQPGPSGINPPGFQSYAYAASQQTSPQAEDSEMFSGSQLFGIFKTLLDRLQHCRTKREQVEVVCQYTLEVLYGKNLELSEFLRNHEIDVAAISETHMQPGDKVWVPDYIPITLERTNARKGGVAVLVHHLMNFRVLPSLQTSIIEAVGVEIDTSTGPVAFVAVYCPKQCATRDGSLAKLKNDIGKLTRRYPKFVIAGDLNARHSLWGNPRSNPNGKMLAEDLQSGHYVVIYPETPTFYSAAGVGSTLDIILTNLSEFCTTPEALTELRSDHLPVIFNMEFDINVRQQSRRHNYHRADWPQYQQLVDDRLEGNPALVTTEDIDAVLRTLEDAINEAKEQHIPTSAITSKFINLDTETKRIITLRNAVRRQYQRTGNVARKMLYKKLNAIISVRVDKFRNRQFSNHIKDIPSYSKPFWRLTKVLKNKPKPIPPLKENDLVRVTPLEKANLIAKHFEASHNLGRDMVSPMEGPVLESIFLLSRAPCVLPEDQKITLNELTNCLKNLKNMKAPGFDGIFNITLKHLGNNARALLVDVFNHCLELGYFPSAWKRSKVVPILKPGKDPSSPSSYRPISLLPSLSKLFERMIYTRLLDHVVTNNILLDEQFGFRRGHSTVDQLQRVVHMINRARGVSKTTVMALMDIEKAFDNVWHDGLVHKLKQFNVPTYLVKTIADYLDRRTAHVVIANSISEPIHCSAGVPQGSLLGPLFYLCYTSDVPPIPDDGTLSLFADDSAITFEGRNIGSLVAKLQRGLDSYCQYLATWKIKVNPTKTQAIVFPHRNTERLKPTNKVKVLGVESEWASEVRYLGITLDSKLLFRSHVEDRLTKGTNMLRQLYPIINRRSKATLANKMAVYKMVVSPMITYGAPVWRGCAPIHRKKLQVLQNKFLRLILNQPWRTRTTDLHRMANLEMIDDELLSLAAKHRTRSITSEFDLIRGLYQ